MQAKRSPWRPGAVLLALGLSALPLAAQTSAGQPSPRDLRAAECVAALDASTHALAQQVQGGKDSLRPTLMAQLIAGAAFVGEAYLHGVGEERARELADEARARQERLPARELAARQAACAEEGRKLYESANGLERAVVKRVATKRMDKLLGG
jgi:hypothetical protein